MRKYESDFVELLKTDYNPKEMAEKISYVVNSFTISTKEIIRSIISSEVANRKMNEISYFWIRIIGSLYENPHSYDDRNKQAYKICNKLLKCESENLILRNTKDLDSRDVNNHMPESTNAAFQTALYLTREHRTLQQTFTGLVFSYLTETCPEFVRLSEKAGYGKLGYMLMI